MRAYEIQPGSNSLDGIKLVTRPDPEPGPGQVVIRPRGWTLNFRDLSTALGRYPQRLEKPIVALSDAAGEVVKLGAGVSRWKVGDRVASTFFQGWIDGRFRPEFAATALGGGTCDGVLAEQAVLSAEGLVRMPEGLDFPEAASLTCAGLTAWQALFVRGKLAPGEWVLALGTGGVSIFALQFAKAAGARVVVTSSSDEKLVKARQLGADVTVNYKKYPDWETEVVKATGGQGIDHVIEVGGAGTIAKSLAALRHGGQIGVIGNLSGREATLNLSAVLGRLATVNGIYVGSRTMYEAMNAAVAANRIKPVIDRTFPFDKALDAYRYQLSGAHFGKVAIAN
jgi:NADPH:quinone reductase-like Zn-dependent oxidoreductase